MEMRIGNTQDGISLGGIVLIVGAFAIGNNLLFMGYNTSNMFLIVTGVAFIVLGFVIVYIYATNKGD